MTQWHFNRGDGHWQPFTDDECTTLNSALAYGQSVARLSKPGVQCNVDLVHMVMHYIGAANEQFYAAVSNAVSPASAVPVTKAPAAEAAAEADMQPAPKRANRSESVLRLSLPFLFVPMPFTRMSVQSQTLPLLLQHQHPQPLRPQHLQRQRQRKMTRVTVRCATETKRSLSRRARASSTRWRSRKTAGFACVPISLIHRCLLFSLMDATDAAEGLSGAGKGRRGVQRDAQPDKHRTEQQQVLHHPGLCPRLQAHLPSLVSLGPRFATSTFFFFFILMLTMMVAHSWRKGPVELDGVWRRGHCNKPLHVQV